MRSEAETIKLLSRFRPSFLDDMRCTIVGVDVQNMTCSMQFNLSKSYCHSGDIVQGGFVSAMLDAVSTHAVFAANEKINSVSTLEFKTMFLEASRAGKFEAFGRVEKLGRSIAFMTAELRNDKGQLTATMTTIAKVRLSDAS